ncbi:DUF4760 domain-containing protein, partial [Campylobacter jejuni]|uniref:DUF4760 domain-containing protein n=1 Tax=Campylobacter jejuni TaxID=197 RepID=UPI003D34FD40
MLKEIKEKPELKRSIIMMMNYFETLQTFIENNRIDEGIIMEHFNSGFSLISFNIS